MPYVVLVDKLAGGETGPDLPKVVAHNLSREAADRTENEFRLLLGAGITAAIWEYGTLHPEGEPEDCLQCAEIILEHCRSMLRLAEKEVARRDQQILQNNLEDKQSGQD